MLGQASGFGEPAISADPIEERSRTRAKTRDLVASRAVVFVLNHLHDCHYIFKAPTVHEIPMSSFPDTYCNEPPVAESQEPPSSV